MKKYVPFCTANSIYDVNLDFFKKLGTPFLLLDLDNTLDGPHVFDPSDKAKELIKKIKDNGLTPIIISNNKKSRVNHYAKQIDVDYCFRALKPFSFRLKSYLKKKNINNNSVIMIGDQTFTDIRCANGCGIKSILTNRLTEKDQIVTIINRKIDTHYRHLISKNGLSKTWEEIYAKIS